MIIMIDGMDRCCKGTLIDHLRSRIKTPKISVRHEGKPPKGVDPLVWSIQHYEYFFESLKNIDWNEETIICDRTHLGELIYGPLYRKYNSNFILDLEKDFVDNSTNDVYLIVLVDSGKNIIGRSDGLSIEQFEDQFDNTRDKFIESYSKSQIKNKILINLDTGSGSRSIEDILKIATNFIGL